MRGRIRATSVPCSHRSHDYARTVTTVLVLSLAPALSWIGFLASSINAQSEPKPEVKKWEYQETSKNELVHYGEVGWEAYAVFEKRGHLDPTYFLKVLSRG